jgi:dipeptidyl aminopeptidase/acylaminoacyl peptidase
MTTPLIPRSIIFGNPVKAVPQLSPDGARMCYLAPDEGVLNVWLRTVGQDDDRVITRDRGRGIREYFWSEDGRYVLYIQDQAGDENWHLHAVDPANHEDRDLTPFAGVRVEGVHTDHAFPGQVLLGMNQRDPHVMDIHRCDLASGSLTMEAENPGDYVGWIPDNTFQVRAAMAALEDGGYELLLRDGAGEFTSFMKWGPEDQQQVLGFTPDNNGLYLEDSAGVNTTQLYEVAIATQEKKVIASDPTVDLGPVMIHPTEHYPQAVGWSKDRLRWKALDPALEADFAALEQVHHGQFDIASRDRADRTWLVLFGADTDPARYYAYDRTTKTAQFLFAARPALEEYTLAPMRSVTIKSRDGLDLVSYLTTPAGVEAKGLPMILNVHGGPWVRDSWGYNGEAQWFANRGYACLQVNYRGSTGFGKDFVNAANREWGARMHDDLLDAVNWAIAEGVADPARIVIYGGSYGGYAALVGAAFTPGVFAAAVDIVGPSNLMTLLNSIPPYWAPALAMFRVRVGDKETEREFLESRSPLFKADQIRIPMLIAQGANDPRVKQAEAEQIVSALRAKDKHVDYLLFPDEGHGFAKPENRMAFYAAAEEFLAKQIGGRAEPPSEAEAQLLAGLRK